MAENSREGALAAYLNEIGKLPLVTTAEEKVLGRKIQRGDNKAREKLIQSNLRLVVKIAHDYANYGLPLLDLISEGNIGLMKAVERFDPERSNKFSTYAAWWIKQGIKRALANQSKTIRLPIHLVDKIAKMRRISMQLAEEFGREPSDEELAEELSLPLKKICQLRRVSLRTTSLNTLVGDDNSTELADLIADENTPDPASLLSDQSLRDNLKGILHVLDERERTILSLRFPMIDEKRQLTLEEVGQKLKVTRERIRQIQNSALQKLKHELDRRDAPRKRSER